ncbi:MAG: hypothetical protein HFH68_07410 [Lachnospiraceae bacterium]|nr:hypothetical protein [Lachnospiraceae bacterium]
MEEQERFLEILGEIKNIAALQNNTLSKEEISRYLGGMDFDSGKIDAVYKYLSAGGIKITGYEGAPDVTETGRTGDRALFNRKLYKQEVEKLGITDSKEAGSIIKGFLMGDDTLRDKLAESKLAHVIKLASGYSTRKAVADKTVSIDEIISEGNVGLLTGIAVISENRAQYIKEDGEPDYEAVYGIINMEIVSAMESFIDMETSGKDWENAMLAKANLLHEAAKYLTGENGNIPSEKELSEYTKIPVEEIRRITGLSEDTKRVVSS